jgi:hypothetical protein
MLAAVTGYSKTLTKRFGRGWNHFWYTPRDVFTLCVLRFLTGLSALQLYLSYSLDLVRWFGPGGLLPIATVRSIAGGVAADGGTGQVSYLFLTDSAVALWLVHGMGAVVLLMFTLGWFTRIASILTLVVLLSYVHRGPMIAGQAETVVTMLVAYLCLAPAGHHLSVDGWWRRRGRRQAPTTRDEENGPPAKFVTAAISTRLIQLHTAAIYLMMGMTQLGGVAWWSGEAYWWLMAQAESPLVDLTFLRDHAYVINLLTHGTVALELAFGVLIWNETARPLLLALAAVMWVLLAVATGLVSFALAMVVAGLVFVSPATLRSAFAPRRAASTAAAGGADG